MKYLEYLKNKKVIYILFLLVICLLPFVLSDTYAKFVSGYVTGEDVVEMNLDFDIGITSIDEYHEVKVSPNSSLKFNVEVKNGSDNTTYYGIWYKMVDPTELPSDNSIEIGKVMNTTGTSSGELATDEVKSASFGIVNSSLNEVIVYIGVASSATSVNDIEYLNGKKLISDEVMMYRDIQITSIKIDGEDSDSLPTTGIYSMSYSCNKNSKLTWDTYSKTITYNKGSKVGDKCSVEFTSSTYYKLLSEMPIGSYVEYVGAGGSVGSSTVSCKKNGSTSSTNVNEPTESSNSCMGQNVREDLDESNYTYGYTSEETHKFVTTGWRLAYVDGVNPVIVSAGSPESISLSPSYIEKFNTSALKYCNNELVEGNCSCLDSNSDGLCDSPSSDVWAINDYDFFKITRAISGYGKRLTSDSSSLGDIGGSLGNELYCVYKNSYAECGYNNDLLDNGGTYWFASTFSSTNTEGVVWQAGYRGVHDVNSGVQGLRPVIKLSKRVSVTGGAGTKEDPYKIEIIEIAHNDFAEKYMKPVANSDASIEFSQTSESSVTNGIYYIEETINDSYPIYYYRGAVDNNLIFAGFCWKIVRTTETGGLKLIYNGSPTDGQCNNTGTSSQIGTKAFNSSDISPAYVGYMHGDVYSYTSKSSLNSDTTEYVYGNDVSYANGTYTLIDTTSGAWSNVYSSGLNNYHYTCFTTGTTCTSVNYIYYTTSSKAYYITLNGEANVEVALSNMLDKNTTSSTIKGSATTSGTLDYWYYNNIEQKGYKEYIEGTVWCNDRSIYSLGGWNPDGGTTSSNYQLYFGAYNRAYETYTPDLTCARNIDKFTVDEKNGNGDLTYPVGLLTADEIMLAGGKYGSSNSSYYLYTGEYYWSGSPCYFSHNYAFEFRVSNDGSLGNNYVNRTYGVRPSLSLKRGFTIASGGDGTTENPYVVE